MVALLWMRPVSFSAVLLEILTRASLLLCLVSTTATTGPNGSLFFLSCGISETNPRHGGWNPPEIQIDQVIINADFSPNLSDNDTVFSSCIPFFDTFQNESSAIGGKYQSIHLYIHGYSTNMVFISSSSSYLFSYVRNARIRVQSWGDGKWWNRWIASTLPCTYAGSHCQNNQCLSSFRG